ncbi:MAG: hypothetical protein HOP21_10860 [Methylotenera sp.]|nr:hypothetical protein [Methylotenera sp.]
MARIKGTSSNNYLTGSTANDFLIGLGGDDTLNGGAGNDTASYLGNIAEFRFANLNGKLVIQDLISVNGSEGKDTLSNIEQIQFDNAQLTVSGGELLVNTYTDFNQASPSVAALADGGFVVSWQSDGQDGSDNGIYAQRYDATGTPQGSEFLVNLVTLDGQTNPSVAGLEDGGFVIAWEASSAFSGEIIVRRYDAAGNAISNDILVNSTIATKQEAPSVTALTDGGFVVSWTSYNQDHIDGFPGVYLQQYDANGSPTGGEVLVNSNVIETQSASTITALAGGGFVVSWQTAGVDGDDFSIAAQIFDASGSYYASEFRVNSHTASAQTQPSIAALADGGFVVSWDSYAQDGDSNGIYAQRFDATGNPLGSEFRVNTYTIAHQYQPSIAALTDGGFVVSWTSLQDGSVYGVYAQRYDAAGVAQGAEFQVNTYISDWQYKSTIAGLADGGFVISWESAGQDTPIGAGIYAQRYDAAGNAVGLKLTGTDNAEVINLDAGTGLVVETQGGNDTVNGAAAHDTIFGGAGNDVLNGGLGDDFLNGGTGINKLSGGKGHDTYVLDNVKDTVTELVGAGIDEVQASFSYTLGANVENLTLTGANSINGTGNAVRNLITGNAGANLMDGKAGADVLEGGAGFDTLVGGAGNDFLMGGAGADTFRFNSALSATNNVDTIDDFNWGEGDKIQLSKAIFTTVGDVGVLSLDAFAKGNFSVAQDATDRIIYNSTTGDLYYDKDGTGAAAAIKFAHLDAGLDLINSDISVIA